MKFAARFEAAKYFGTINTGYCGKIGQEVPIKKFNNHNQKFI
jgi:hypothetical protein